MHNRGLQASSMLMVGGAFWGLLWIPLRIMEEQGLHGAWPTLIAYGAPSLILIPLSLIRWRTISQKWLTILVVGLFCGASFSLYGIAVLLTEVSRVILLFYLTPVWGTMIGVFLLKERLTVRRVLALSAGLIGMLIVLDLGVKLPWPRNVGDWMAFAAGVTWACGSTALYQSSGVKAIDQISSFVIGGVVFTALIMALAWGSLGGMPETEALTGSLPTSALMALMIPPVLLITIVPATLLPPGRVGILLMTEVVFGIGSAWLWANEVLSLRECIGAFLILSATVIEVTGPSEPTPAAIT